jgi:glutamate N-acetyltransferase/amino-acid N-acetyltransferase
MSVDGDTSTNDTVLLLASGQSGVRLKYPSAKKKFSKALQEVCQSLADQIIADGEGVQHVIHLSIEQAKNRDEALRVARAIAHSLLVKTAWAGADPNWGRVLAALGNCGVPVDPARVNIFIGKQQVCRGGVGCPFDEARAHADLSQHDCKIRIQLHRGQSQVLFQTTDLTAEYVRINADYST